MGRAAAVLERIPPRWAALGALTLVVAAYFAIASRLPHVDLWSEVVLLGLFIIPPVFALVWLALPLWRSRGVGLVGLAFGVLAVVFEVAGLDILADLAKLAALTLIAFWFLGYFESAAWVAIVALIIPAVDAFSVFRGPTGHVIENRPGIFETIAFGFPVPGRRDILLDWDPPERHGVRGYNVYRITAAGETRRPPVNGDELIRGTSYSLDGVPTDEKWSFAVETVATDGSRFGNAVAAPPPGRDTEVSETRIRRAPQRLTATAEGSFARLGPPDFLFFALFLGAAARFRLRVAWTWAAMTASFGVTLALAVWFDLAGLPALPILSFGFLLPNADRLWRSMRRLPDPARAPSE